MSFRLYATEQHWCSFADYGAIKEAVEGLGAKSVLEFGPGSSTLALIEGGATRIDACEDDPNWEAHYRLQIEKRFPHHVQIHRYLWSDPLFIPVINGRRYDLGLVDGPQETPRRAPAIAYALERCTRVLVPCEDAAGPGLRATVERLAGRRQVGYKQTGPLAGSYALIGPAC